MIPLKQWLHEEALRERRPVSTVHGRYYSGKYRVKLMRKNARVIFVVKSEPLMRSRV